MESLKTIFENVNSPEKQNYDLLFLIILFLIISDDLAQEKKIRRQKQQRRFQLANQPKRPKPSGPKMF